MQNNSSNVVSVFSILYFLKCAFRIVVFGVNVMLSYFILFRDCQISYKYYLCYCEREFSVIVVFTFSAGCK